MRTEVELKVEDKKNKTEHRLLALAGCVCMVSGMISLFCGNLVSACAMMGVGLMDVGLVLYYYYSDKKNA